MAEKKQTLAGIIRQNLSIIEEKKKNGFLDKSILSDLNNELDLTISIGHFRFLLHLARQRKASEYVSTNSPTSLEIPLSSNEALSPSNPITRHKDTETKTTRQNLNEIIKSKPDLTSYAEIAKGNK